jgi:predicted enzyme related to lactoylglutathione lyase
MYSMIHEGEDGLAGVVPLDPARGMPSHWITYISVDDVDSACVRVNELGGQVHVQPFDIPEVGRTAVVQDPTGAFFSPFKGSDPDWRPVPRRFGTFAWHELLTTDIEKAKPFYTEIMGWGLKGMDMGPMGTYWLFRQDEQDAAGAMQLPPDAPSPSNWLPYVGVADVPGTVKKAEELGASVMLPPQKMEEPAKVHFAVLASPDGAAFGVLEVTG